VRLSRNLRVQKILNPGSRVFVFAIILFAFSIILFIGRFELTQTAKNLRSQVTSISYSVAHVVSMPSNLINSGIQSIIDLKKIYQQLDNYNINQLTNSSSFQDIVSMKLKIAQYEDLLNLTADLEYDFVTSRIVADFSDKFIGTILIKSNETKKIFVDMPAAGPNGILGRVSSVDNKIGRVLLLNNINSRLPVSISENAHQGIMIGQGQKNPIVEYVREYKNINVGDIVSTSGKGGIFPPYLVVGQVASIDGEKIEVELIEDISQLTHIRLLNYNFNQNNE
tara:strand:+ start:362 stop:1204 length:843 start_codon:yes stop_codon:yes gene_type:complete